MFDILINIILVANKGKNAALVTTENCKQSHVILIDAFIQHYKLNKTIVSKNSFFVHKEDIEIDYRDEIGIRRTLGMMTPTKCKTHSPFYIGYITVEKCENSVIYTDYCNACDIHQFETHLTSLSKKWNCIMKQLNLRYIFKAEITQMSPN